MGTSVEHLPSEIPGEASPLSELASGPSSNELPDIIYPWPHFYWVVDYREMRNYNVKGCFEQITGHSKEFAENSKSELMLSLLHPDDREKALELTAYFHAFIALQPAARGFL